MQWTSYKKIFASLRITVCVTNWTWVGRYIWCHNLHLNVETTHQCFKSKIVFIVKGCCFSNVRLEPIQTCSVSSSHLKKCFASCINCEKIAGKKECWLERTFLKHSQLKLPCKKFTFSSISNYIFAHRSTIIISGNFPPDSSGQKFKT